MPTAKKGRTGGHVDSDGEFIVVIIFMIVLIILLWDKIFI